MDNGNLDNIVFVLLFSADEPLTMRKLASILEDTPAAEIRNSIERWRQKLDEESWSVCIERVAGGYQVSSRTEYASYIAKLYSGRRKLRLSKAALEALAIIAYKQPVTRAEIENVRGVACGGVVSNLMERSLIKITGKAKILGAPFLYGTTHDFLEYLGLNSLKDLPSMEELESLLEKEESLVAAEAPADPTEAVLAELTEAADEIPGIVQPEPPGQLDGEVNQLIDEQESLAAQPETDAQEVKDVEEIEVEEIKPESLPEEYATTASAQIGPDIEEPYHRPLGDSESNPLRTHTEDVAPADETNTHTGVEDEDQVSPESSDHND